MSKMVTVALDLASEQGGMLTTQQALRRGVSRLALSRLADQGVIERLAHGVYATAEGAFGKNSALKAAWLSLDPHRFAFERMEDDPAGFTVTHRPAAELWGIGQLIPDKLEIRVDFAKANEEGRRSSPATRDHQRRHHHS